MMACIALLLASCQQEQIVFDHEQQQFATLENAILVELIAPWFDPLSQPAEPKEEATIDLYIYNATETLTPLN